MIPIAFEIQNAKIITRALEYNVVEHCNLKCRFCDHSSPLMPPHIVPVAEFVKDTARLATVLHTSEFKVIGGEPLLHPEIITLIDHVREVGIADAITVATNGLLLHRMPERFWGQIDRLWLSLYPGVRVAMPIEDVERRARAFGFRLDVFRMNSFRQTTLSRPAGTTEVVRAIFQACELPRINYCHTVRRGLYYKCSPAPFSEERLLRFGIKNEAGDSDGVPIHDNPNLLSDLASYLSCENPLPACKFCLGSSGKWSPHGQMTTRELLNEGSSEDDPATLLDWAKLPQIRLRSPDLAPEVERHTLHLEKRS